MAKIQIAILFLMNDPLSQMPEAKGIHYLLDPWDYKYHCHHEVNRNLNYRKFYFSAVSNLMPP